MINFLVSTQPVDYEDAVNFMEAKVQQIIHNNATSMIWLLEHPKLYTAGISTKEDQQILPYPIYKTSRGGKITYHGPGQRVVYNMLNLKTVYNQPDVRRYVYDLEQVVIDTLKQYGIDSFRSDIGVGIWTEHNGQKKKIAALGVKIKKWVTYHGVAINYAPDLKDFDNITPCGIKGFGITSIQDLGLDVDIKQLDAILMNNLKEKFC